MTKSEFIAMVKNHMRNFKNQWLTGCYPVEENLVSIKLYNKSIQVLSINGERCPSVWDLPTQKAVIQFIEKYL